MASMQEEMDDSRTSEVGRKRNLRDSPPQDDATRASKRAKENDIPLEEEAAADDGVAMNLMSPPNLPAESHIQSTIAAPLRAAVWNKGVQSGVRTSFGSRVHIKPKPKPFISPEQDPDAHSNRTVDLYAYEVPPAAQDTKDVTMADATNLQENQALSTTDHDAADIGMAEQNALPPREALSSVEQGGSDTFMAGSLDRLQEHELPTTKQGVIDELQIDLPLSSGEEEGEIVSSRATAAEAGTLQQETTVPGQYASAGSSLVKNGDPGNSMPFHAPHSSYGGETLPADGSVAKPKACKRSGSERKKLRREAHEAAEELSALTSNYDPVGSKTDSEALPQADTTSTSATVPAVAVEQNSSDAKNNTRKTPAQKKTIRRLDPNLLHRKAREAASKTTRASSHDSDGGTDPHSLSEAPTVPNSFRVLSNDQTAKLSQAERSAYFDALKLHEWAQIEDRTAAANAVFEHVVLPLQSGKYSSIWRDIHGGRTFFPRRYRKQQYYQKAGINFKLSEVLNDSKPIRLQDITVSVFAPGFLNQNSRNTWQYLTERPIFAAYNQYLHLFYNQCAKMPAWTAAIARFESDKTTFSLKEVIRIATSSQPQSANDGPAQLSKASVKEEEDQSIATVSRPESVKDTHIRADRAIVTAEEPQRLAREICPNSQPMSNASHGPDKASTTVEVAQGVAADVSAQSARDVPVLSGSSVDLAINESMQMDIDPSEVEDDLERDLQQKYFPSTVDRLVPYYCLACGDGCHKTLDCPSLTCTVCGGNHAQSTCPQNQRCKKCRYRGHQTAECPEKLARSQDESVDCELCGNADHWEEDCHYIWRTFNPTPKDIRKVREILAHCYSCGATGHFGPDCGIRKPGRILSGGQTFSMANLSTYVDASSIDRAISAGVDYSITSKSKKHISIKGMANDPISLDDGDDDVQFITEKVKKPKGNGKIKVAAPKKGKFQQVDNYSRRPSPPRQPPLEFGPDFAERGIPPREFESARYGRERTFSPPPRFDDTRYGFPRTDDRYRPQDPQRGEHFYRSQPQQSQNYYHPAQGALSIGPPLMASGNGPTLIRNGVIPFQGSTSGVGNTGRGGRGGSENTRGGRRSGRNPKRGGARERGGRGG